MFADHWAGLVTILFFLPGHHRAEIFHRAHDAVNIKIHVGWKIHEGKVTICAGANFKVTVVIARRSIYGGYTDRNARERFAVKHHAARKRRAFGTCAP